MRSAFVSTLLLALSAGAWADAPAPLNGSGLLAPLKKGQRIAVREMGDKFEISMMPGVELGHKVVEVGSDYLVVEDAASITETRIPIYSIRSIKVVRLPAEKRPEPKKLER